MAKELLEVSRRRKQRWALIKFGSWIFIAAFIFGAFLSVFYVPQLRIDFIAIRGAESVDENKLLADLEKVLAGKYFFLIPKNNIIFFPRHDLGNVIDENIRIASYTIKRNFPSALEVTVQERKTWAVWCKKDGEIISSCALTDNSGFVFASSPLFSGSAILKIIDERGVDRLGGYFLDNDSMDTIRFLIESVKNVGEEVLSVDLKTDNTFNIALKSGWFLVVDFETEKERAYENLSLALNSELKDARDRLEYVDLRFPDKIFYRFKAEF